MHNFSPNRDPSVAFPSRRFRWRFDALLLCVTAILQCQSALGANDEKGTLTVLLENDAFATTDQHYTNGFQLSYLTAPREEGGLASNVFGWIPGNANSDVRVGWQLGHAIFTPNDKVASELLPEERPYAAWLYGGLSLIYSSDRHIDTWSLTVGTVGPDAKGEEIQNSIHEWSDNQRANGWDNQLDNQLGGTLIVERKWRKLAQMDVLRLGVDFMPHVGVSIGNIEQYANSGFTVRLGNDLDNDFGPPRIRPSLPGSDYFVPHDNWSWYLFAGIDGRYVDKNIFIDDNDKNDLFNIEKNDWVADAQAGLVITRGDFRMAYTYVYRSAEFKQQTEKDRFGSLAFTWRF